MPQLFTYIPINYWIQTQLSTLLYPGLDPNSAILLAHYLHLYIPDCFQSQPYCQVFFYATIFWTGPKPSYSHSPLPVPMFPAHSGAQLSYSHSPLPVPIMYSAHSGAQLSYSHSPLPVPIMYPAHSCAQLSYSHSPLPAHSGPQLYCFHISLPAPLYPAHSGPQLNYFHIS